MVSKPTTWLEIVTHLKDKGLLNGYSYDFFFDSRNMPKSTTFVKQTLKIDIPDDCTFDDALIHGNLFLIKDENILRHRSFLL